jgi:hypothetical protein
MRRMDDFGVSDLPQATERAFLDGQLGEDTLYTTAVASAPGNTEALALVRAAVEQLKANLKAELPLGVSRNLLLSGLSAAKPITVPRTCGSRYRLVPQQTMGFASLNLSYTLRAIEAS